jgi:Na+/melibiose symporter-like transporter
MIIKQFWDGGIDPLIGVLSENVNTRFGKRKPMIVAFVWPAAVMWVLMWSSPNFTDSQPLRIGYYAICILLFGTFDSLVVVPYQSLIPDMAEGYHSRTFVVLFAQVFQFIGTGLSSFVWSYLIELYAVDPSDPLQKGMDFNYYKGYFVASMIILVPVVIAYLLSAFVAVERVDEKKKKPYPPTDDEDFVEIPLTKPAQVFAWVKKQAIDIKEICTYLPFVIVLGFAIVNFVGTALFTGNFILWIKYDLEDDTRTGVSLLALQVSFLF